ncbi:response regulator transcription factor [Amnibacterium endophyticum]|uniref:DNA-binding response regulator n=1 Tax=Amnibacterium endophyticum TaxID=2109337 RepID=A0ABW4LCE4_9MICO
MSGHSGRRGPIRVALIDDYEVVLAGLGRMLERYADRVEIVEIGVHARVDEPVDVALLDAFAQREPEAHAVARMVDNPMNHHVAVYTWDMRQQQIDASLEAGARGYLAKSLAASELVDALQQIAAGELVVGRSETRRTRADGLDWPGRAEGVTDRESEILAFIAQGLSNADIAELVHLSPNTVKTHIRAAYRKIGVSNRVEAVIWGARHGFRPDHRSVDHWLEQSPT